MSASYSGINWELIYQTAFITEEKCWDKFSCGSYCCKTDHADFNFRFIRSNMVWLPLSPAEHHYLVKIDKLQDYDKGNIVKHSLEFLPGKQATVYMMRCKQQGLCINCDFRPLICRIYPYFPLPDHGGTVTDIIPSSIFDQMWYLKQQTVGCPMRNDLGENRDILLEKFAPRMQIMFKEPHLIFYFRAAKIIMDSMIEILQRDHTEVLKPDNRNFWQDWEMLFLSQELIDKDAVAKKLASEYASISSIWGEFDTE